MYQLLVGIIYFLIDSSLFSPPYRLDIDHKTLYGAAYPKTHRRFRSNEKPVLPRRGAVLGEVERTEDFGCPDVPQAGRRAAIPRTVQFASGPRRGR